MLPASYAMPAAAVLVIGGLLACVAGYRLFRFVLGLYGFILGASITASMMSPASTWTLVVAGLVGGLLGAGLMVAAYFLGVGLIGAGLGALALNVGWHHFAATPDPPVPLLVIVAVVGALGALSVVRHVVIIGTALAGSWTMLIGILALRGDQAAMRAASAGDIWILYPLDPSPSRWWAPFAWIGIAIVGALIQLATTKKNKTQ
jgi:Domain of unknown function (DUF4203)